MIELTEQIAREHGYENVCILAGSDHVDGLSEAASEKEIDVIGTEKMSRKAILTGV